MADAPQVVHKMQIQQALPSPPAPTYEEKQAYVHPTYDMGNLEAGRQHREVLGLRRRNFWILVFLALVVLCAAIGGSVGGTLAVQNRRSNAAVDTSSPPTSQSPSSIPTNSPTNTPPPATSATSSATLQPPSTTTPSSTTAATSNIPYAPLPPTLVPTIDNSCPSSTLSAFNGATYTCTTDSNFFGGDITGIVAYTLQQCIDACTTMNEVSGDKKCVAIALNHDLAAAYRNLKGANCWLKSGVGGGRQEDKGVTVAALVG
ncbi:hypothetical protein T440DRAFT_472462 [Plenodomus tracheiphilus IPT5]|uniref:Apple domain-containing protein n=1 Tax=Plenodomus tracheiphilus IPT5 TaxID=1408161 RepID=A0A6A7AQZ9_9PLEO|nr:hypothetical protein T440DRAFT_472462 [Plenodomus tracheiphilus IPT5]